jgi:hypothetical protein
MTKNLQKSEQTYRNGTDGSAYSRTKVTISYLPVHVKTTEMILTYIEEQIVFFLINPFFIMKSI